MKMRTFLHCSPAGSYWTRCMVLDESAEGWAWVLYYDVWLQEYEVVRLAKRQLRNPF